jgi:hypothetical protein
MPVRDRVGTMRRITERAFAPLGALVLLATVFSMPLPASAQSQVCCQCDECNANPGLCFVEAPSDAECDALCETFGCAFSSTSTPGVCVSDPRCGPGTASNPGVPLASGTALLVLVVALLIVGLGARTRQPPA